MQPLPCASECTAWKFNYSGMDVSTSMQESFNLVCNKEVILKYHGSIYFLGLFFGSLLCGFMSDRIGRVKWFRTCIAVIALCAVVIGATNSVILHLVSWFVTSFQLIGIWVCAFTYCSEIVSVKYRDIPGMLEAIFFGFAIAFCSLLAYFITDWKHLTLVLSLIAFSALLLSFVLPESPRWLWNIGRYEEAIDTLKSAVRLDGGSINEELEEELEEIIEDGELKLGYLESLVWDLNSIFGNRRNAAVDDAPQKNYSVIDIFRHRFLAIRIILLSYHWIVVNILYYGLLFGATLFNQHLHLYSALQGLASSVGCAWAIVFLRVMGRKTLIICCFFITGCCFAISIFTSPTMQVVLLILSFLGKVTLQIIFILCYTWTAELNPTMVRSSAIGFGSMTARLTGLSVPFFSNFSSIWEPLPLLIFSLMAFSVIICSLLLPETRGRKLPETIEEGEGIGRKDLEMCDIVPLKN